MKIPSQEGVMTIYSLTKQAGEWKGKGTNLKAALEALKGLGGKATGAQIADYAEEKKLLKTEMDVRQAISWTLNGETADRGDIPQSYSQGLDEASWPTA
jgi:hypothetical protein